LEGYSNEPRVGNHRDSSRCLATFILIVDLIIPKGESRQGLGIVTIFGLLAILGFTFTQFNVSGTLYKGIYVIDQYACFSSNCFWPPRAHRHFLARLYRPAAQSG
jgi:hypothetical protein